MMTISKSEEETKKIAKAIAKRVKNGGFIALFGDLGSGKTVFVKGLAEAFGIKNFSVKSPTYTYIREIFGSAKIYHIDLYRLEKIDELLLQEILELMEDEKNIIIIEWAEKMADFLPMERIDVKLKYIDENSRLIEIFFENFYFTQEIKKIYQKFSVPPHIIKHMEIVAKVCGILADKLIKKGKKIDKKRLIEAALLHDVLKICHVGHEKAMEKVLKNIRKKNIAKIVGKHGFSSIDKLKTLEEKILYYADKRVHDEKIVSLKKRFEEGDKRYGKRLDKRAVAIKKKIFALEKELEAMLGESIYNL